MPPVSVIHVSPFPPTACGVAEYAEQLKRHLHAAAPDLTPFLIRLDASVEGVDLARNGLLLNPANAIAIDGLGELARHLENRVVLVQHEFKLYGGQDGENVLRLIDALDAPIITTLHTVRPDLSGIRKRVLDGLIVRSALLVVFSAGAGEIVVQTYGANPDKVVVIPHGVPDVEFQRPQRRVNNTEPRPPLKFVTAGLLRASKGIETALAAFREVRDDIPPFSYVICGADHPKNPTSSSYRRALQMQVDSYGLSDQVVFLDRYLSTDELIAEIQSCDIGLLPYSVKEQSSSGVLATMLACARPVISADFQYARAVLRHDNGIIVPTGDVVALADAIRALSMDDGRRDRMMGASFAATRTWLWKPVAEIHRGMIKRVLAQKAPDA